MNFHIYTVATNQRWEFGSKARLDLLAVRAETRDQAEASITSDKEYNREIIEYHGIDNDFDEDVVTLFGGIKR
jgi:hypothetical protein